MTFDAKEKSTYGGEPVECYRFAISVNVWRFTSSDTIAVISEAGAVQNYTPLAIRRDGFEFSEEEGGGAVKLRLPRDNEVALLFVPYTPSDPVALTIYTFHRDDSEVAIAFVGKIVSADFTEHEAILTALPTRSVLSRRLPRLSYQGQCNWPLYSVPCGVDKALFKIDGILSAASGADVQATNWGAKPDGYFTNGFVQRSTGERRFVIAHVGTTLTLMAPFFGLVLGETLSAFAGCDRTETTCSSKFSNLTNHLGFPRIPQRNPHEKGLG